MKVFPVLLIAIFFLSSCVLRKSVGDACLDHHRVSWDYSKKRGPKKWADLSREFEICTSGTHQSPIDIHPEKISQRKDFRLSYANTEIDLIDNEHTIEFDYEPGSFLFLEGDKYELKQFHFHSPSEHEVNGKRYDMEVHLVHKNQAGKLAVIGLLVEEGKNNDLIGQIWRHLPHDKDKHHIFPNERVNILDLIPHDKKAYYYSGSLTTPPCSESVHWLVIEKPIEFSKDEIDYFHSFYNWNIRSIQS